MTNTFRGHLLLRRSQLGTSQLSCEFAGYGYLFGENRSQVKLSRSASVTLRSSNKMDFIRNEWGGSLALSVCHSHGFTGQHISRYLESKYD